MSLTTEATPAATAGRAPADLRRRRTRRSATVLGCGVALLLVLAMLALTLGAAGLTPRQVLLALTGAGESSEVFVMRRLRLPRVLAAVAAGAALGTAGALFQSTLRNPLASPDILGISAGASLGAVCALLGLGLTGAAVAGFAGVGALATALAIWLFAWRQGLHGIRFVLVGIGFAYLATSLISWLLTRAEVRDAAGALLWTVGSVGDVRGPRLTLLLASVAVLLPLALRQHARQRILALGDDHARGLGVAADRSRASALLLGTALVAAAASVAGPVPFVALVAPAIARGLLDDGGPALATSGLVGASLMLGGDVIGQHALPFQLAAPVGIVTGIIGAPYLIWLLARTGRGTSR
ncbi:FecCD family ABC transporter permease [Egicoccus halophilus]|uniref:ABC transporter permease n=1 Tax=Egicoccus halophilus TaxID=1670830 RepID=A0A8J3AA26_9ACTN|nr:iron chelate uptake ABC transporter family permease subunit [Egicoccus halophilus]GGI08667.1 ABC transporter permease [Egicoccus halophilus]